MDDPGDDLPDPVSDVATSVDHLGSLDNDVDSPGSDLCDMGELVDAPGGDHALPDAGLPPSGERHDGSGNFVGDAGKDVDDAFEDHFGPGETLLTRTCRVWT